MKYLLVALLFIGCSDPDPLKIIEIKPGMVTEVCCCKVPESLRSIDAEMAFKGPNRSHVVVVGIQNGIVQYRHTYDTIRQFMFYRTIEDFIDLMDQCEPKKDTIWSADSTMYLTDIKIIVNPNFREELNEVMSNH